MTVVGGEVWSMRDVGGFWTRLGADFMIVSVKFEAFCKCTIMAGSLTAWRRCRGDVWRGFIAANELSDVRRHLRRCRGSSIEMVMVIRILKISNSGHIVRVWSESGGESGGGG